MIRRIFWKNFLHDIKEEKPDAVIIAGDLYDRAVPPTEAVQLLNDVFDTIVLDLHTPVLAIAGNHDSPSRLQFGSKLMREQGLHICGTFTPDYAPVILHDAFGEVHFHLVPYCDPSIIAHAFRDESINTHDKAMHKVLEHLKKQMDPEARHVFIGHAFVTPYGREEENTSESERPLSIGGSEYVDANYFMHFDYTALGHLHQAHFVTDEAIRYAGSPLKYSLSEARHKKGYYCIELGKKGVNHIEKKLLTPRRDLRLIEGKMEDLLQMEISEDYVFVRLLDETPVLSPMEKLRSVFPNCMHVERRIDRLIKSTLTTSKEKRQTLNEQELFTAFYQEVTGKEASSEAKTLFAKVLDEMMQEENEGSKLGS